MLHEWRQAAASRSFERRTELRERMPDDERFLLRVRRECLDQLLVLHERQLSRLLKTYIVSFHQARPHQGLGQRIPDPPVRSPLHPNHPHKVIAVAVLGGLHHDDQRRAEAVEVVWTKDDCKANIHSELPSAALGGVAKLETMCFCCSAALMRIRSHSWNGGVVVSERGLTAHDSSCLKSIACFCASRPLFLPRTR